MEITLLDDGQGFDLQNCAGGNGLKNMQARARKIAGQLHISSQMGRGATIRFRGKLP